MERLPNLLVIGAMKCGTSSLHRYLDSHPEIAMSHVKELNFFLPADAATTGGAGGLLAEQSTAERGIGWYTRQFGSAPVCGESSVAYSFPWFDSVATRIAETLGSPRLIYLVRDPIERMLSHRDQFAGRDRRPTDEALSDPGGPYLRASCYATALAPFLTRFERSDLLILDQARLRDEREAALAEIFEFLGVDPCFRSPALGEEANVSGNKGRSYRAAERLRSSRPGSAVASRLPRGFRAQAERALHSAGTGAPPSRRAALDPALEGRLLQLLEPEIAGLELITGWDLSRWRLPAARC